jgi:hypothetical protein
MYLFNTASSSASQNSTVSEDAEIKLATLTLAVSRSNTDKENKIFLMYKKNQKGAVAESYMRRGRAS